MPRRFGPRYRVPFRRRREGRTDYRARYKMLLSRKIRAVVRKSLRHMIVHFVKAEIPGDRTLVMARSLELKKYGWEYGCGNIPAAYLTGYLAGLKALKAGITEAILDIGPQRAVHGGRLFAALKGMVDAGVQIPHDPVIYPKVYRIRGEHIAEYARKLKEENEEKYKKQFSGYLSRGLDPEKIPEAFERTLKAIAQAFGVEPPSLEEEEEEEEWEEEEFEEEEAE